MGLFDNILENFYSCMDCGARKSELIQDPETKRTICKDREICEHMQAWGENNA